MIRVTRMERIESVVYVDTDDREVAEQAAQQYLMQPPEDSGHQSFYDCEDMTAVIEPDDEPMVSVFPLLDAEGFAQ